MTERIPRPETIQMLIAVPKDVRHWLEEKAARNLTPMTGLIVTAVRRQMDAERANDALAGQREG
jgi:hypothetical protein